MQCFPLHFPFQGNLSMNSAMKQPSISSAMKQPTNNYSHHSSVTRPTNPPTNTQHSITSWHQSIPPTPAAPPNTPLVPPIPTTMFHPTAMTNFLNAFPQNALPPPPAVSPVDPMALVPANPPAFKQFQTLPLHHQQQQLQQQHCHQMDLTQQQQEENLRNAAAQILNDRRWGVGVESLFNTLAADPYGIERLARLNKQAAGEDDLKIIFQAQAFHF